MYTNKIIKIYAFFMLNIFLCLHPSAVTADARDDKIKRLEQQMAQMLRHMQALKQEVKALKQEHQQAVASRPDPVIKPRKSSGVVWEVGGYAKLDAVFSDESAGANNIGDEFIVNALIPDRNNNDEDDQIKITARESRIFVKADYRFGDQLIKGYLEGDFFGDKPNNSETLNNNADFRLRQAFAEWTQADGQRWLFGQAWTTFQNLSAFPHTTTLGTLPGQAFTRVPQVRWTLPGQNLGIGVTSWQFSVENPESNLADLNNNAVFPDDDRFPDLVARWNWKADQINVSVALLARQLRCDIDALCEDEALAYGVNLAGRWQVTQADQLRFQLNYGEGIGRFIAGALFPGGVIENGDIERVDVIAGLLSYQHQWSPKWRTSLIFNGADADELDNVANAIDNIQIYHANIMWNPLPPLLLSVEFIHADTERVNGVEGELNRVIFSSKYLF